jgi:sugar phosphate permease
MKDSFRIFAFRICFEFRDSNFEFALPIRGLTPPLAKFLATIPGMRYRVLGFLCAAAVIAYVQRLGLNIAEETLRGDLDLNKEQMGQVMAAWYAGYAIFQLPSGWLADRWGSKPALVFLAVAWSILTGMVPLAWDHLSLLLVWFAMGSVQAGIFPCSAKSIGNWFGDAQRASASGLLASSQALGAAIAPMLTVVLLARFGVSWQYVFLSYGAFGIIWALIYNLAVPALPSLRDQQRYQVPQGAMPVWQSRDWLVLVTSVPMLLLCGQQFFRAAGMVFFYTWFPTFLRQTRDMDLTESGIMTGIVALGAMTGGILGGFASDAILRSTGSRRLSRQGIAVFGISICSVLVLASLAIADKPLAMTCITVGAFCATFGGISGYTVAIDFGGRRVATIFSIMNMSGNIGATIFPWVVGALIERTNDWDLAIFLFAGILAIDAVIWAMLNPKGTLFQDDDAENTADIRMPP